MARRGFDEVISQPEELGGLGLKEITVDTASSGMLPSYLVSLLTYFYLRTKNFKMARAMVKSRRFVVDQDLISQQVRQSEVVPQVQANTQAQTSQGSYTQGSQSTSPGAANTVGKYSKKQAIMMNYKSMAKNFT